ncbi:hypothetical protein BJY52DRAFT_1417649 [Lactarius psammicola]|nr:hypothetical protein BJY52DRAFT_1417649 [Lactarius psammicola]
MALEYPEPHGLLVRPEYDVALGMLNEDHHTAQKCNCGGVVVNGQPGIGKSCFLYYLLLHRLNEMTLVALQLPSYFVVFRDDGVYRHPLDANSDRLPEGTWALSDSNDEAEQPCTAFLTAARRQRAWIVQTAFPLEERWKKWQKYRNADTSVMNHISIQEITILGNILGLDVGNPRHIYEKWGPSARSCVRVENAAQEFIKHAATTTMFDEMKVSHLLFSIRPVKQCRDERRIQIAEVATDHIRTVISYAAAEVKAQERIDFYQTVSTHPWFRVSAGVMFKGLVCSWLYARSNVPPLRCFATGMLDLEIPACGQDQTTFFGSKNGLKNVNGDKKLPLCLLPTSENFPTADAIVTIQVTISDCHDAKKSGFDTIKKLIPSDFRRDKWHHVFITDDDRRAVSLRNQTLNEDLGDILIYSGVFDISRSGVTREDMEAYDEKKKQAELKVMVPQASIGLAVLSEKEVNYVGTNGTPSTYARTIEERLTQANLPRFQFRQCLFVRLRAWTH